MIEIDGSEISGSGTIVRDAVSFSVLTGQEIYLKNIRAKRDKPGLRPQHLKGVEACRQICQGEMEGVEVGSRAIRFRPREIIKGGSFNWDIGTAGSTTMLASTILPLAIFSQDPSIHKIAGGLFQDFAPSAYHLKYVLFPILNKMGIDIDLEIIQPGYVPQGRGVIEIKVRPPKEKIRPLTALEQGEITEIKGIALSSLLREKKVSERMANECQKGLRVKGYTPEIEIAYDTENNPVYQKTSIQAGASLAIWARTITGCLIGSEIRESATSSLHLRGYI